MLRDLWWIDSYIQNMLDKIYNVGEKEVKQIFYKY